jgi:hypothetical protein
VFFCVVDTEIFLYRFVSWNLGVETL